MTLGLVDLGTVEYAGAPDAPPAPPALVRAAGVPQVQLLVRAADGTYPTSSNRAGDLVLDDGWTVTRGREDEFDDANPAQLRLTLDNDDGTYSPAPSGGGLLPPGTWVQLPVTYNGQTYTRFTGPIDAMPLTWPSPLGNLCDVPLEANDSQTMLADVDVVKLRGNLLDEVFYDPGAVKVGSAAAAVTGAPVVVQYVPLSDAADTTNPVVYGPSLAATLQPMNLGLADVEAPVFGGSEVVLPDPEATPAAEFFGDQWLTSPTPVAGGKSLMVAWRTEDPSTGVSSILAGVVAGPTVNAPHVFLAIRDGQLRLLHYGPGNEFFAVDGQFSSYKTLMVSALVAPAGWDPCDGQWHTAVLTLNMFSSDSTEVYVDSPTAYDPVFIPTGQAPFTLDGTLVIGGVDPSALYPPDRPGFPAVPAGYKVAPFTGDLGQVAVHSADTIGAPLDATRTLDLITALRGNPDDSSGRRIDRLFRLAGVAYSTALSDLGVLSPVPPQATAGRAVWGCVDDVADAEGGLVFVDPVYGLPVFQDRTRRVRSATVSGVKAALGGDDYQHGNLRMEVGGRKAPIPSFGLLPETDQRRIDGEAWYAARVDGPRLNSITLDLLTQPDPVKVAAVLALRIGDRITVSGMPAQSPVNPADLIVEGWSEKCTDDEWSITFNTVAASGFRAWVLGDSVYGVLGSTTKLHF